MFSDGHLDHFLIVSSATSKCMESLKAIPESQPSLLKKGTITEINFGTFCFVLPGAQYIIGRGMCSDQTFAAPPRNLQAWALGDSHVRAVIQYCLSALSKERPIFHSEADFQFAFAWKMREQNLAYSVRLEVPWSDGASPIAAAGMTSAKRRCTCRTSQCAS